MLGGLHTGLLVFLRGRGGAQLFVVFLAAALGAWAGDAAGGRLGIDPIRLGDFHFISASILAWAGIAFVEVLFILGPTSPADRSDQ
jgi:hypothetical protein